MRQPRQRPDALDSAPGAATRKRIGGELGPVWNASSLDLAQEELRRLGESYQSPAPNFTNCLESAVPEGLTVFSLPDHHRAGCAPPTRSRAVLLPQGRGEPSEHQRIARRPEGFKDREVAPVPAERRVVAANRRQTAGRPQQCDLAQRGRAPPSRTLGVPTQPKPPRKRAGRGHRQRAPTVSPVEATMPTGPVARPRQETALATVIA